MFLKLPELNLVNLEVSDSNNSRTKMATSLVAFFGLLAVRQRSARSKAVLGGGSHELRISKATLALHKHAQLFIRGAQQAAFRRRDARQESRLFGLQDPMKSKKRP
jgi:hypothetical protein